MKVCFYCGAKNFENAEKCASCGRTLGPSFSLDSTRIEEALFLPLVADGLYQPKALIITPYKIIVNKSHQIRNIPWNVIIVLLSLAVFISIPFLFIKYSITASVVFLIALIANIASLVIYYSGPRENKKRVLKKVPRADELVKIIPLEPNFNSQYEYALEEVRHIFLTRVTEEYSGVKYSGVELRIETNDNNKWLVYGNYYYNNYYLNRNKFYIFGIDIKYLKNLLYDLGLGKKLVVESE